MALSALRHEQRSLLKADSTLRLLDNDKDDTESLEYDELEVPEYAVEQHHASSYYTLRRAALIIAFLAWSITAAPVTFWLGIPWVAVRSASPARCLPLGHQHADF